MERVASHFKIAKTVYDNGGVPLAEILRVSQTCVQKLATEAASQFQAELSGKTYHVFTSENGRISRPYLPSLYVSDDDEYVALWKELQAGCVADEHLIRLCGGLDETIIKVNKALYTAVTSFSVCYDLWKWGSRKTPGTFFEVLLGTWLTLLLRDYQRTKFIELPGYEEKVSTDIVFSKPDGINLVFPAKITTRERIVQPFAHQRILESVFGMNRYRSLLLCMSETQRDDEDRSVNEICVPGTVRLFQKHLSTMSGIYYLDPPQRYLQPNVTDVIPVASVGRLLAADLAANIKQH